VAEVLRVQEELLLRVVRPPRAKRNAVLLACEPLDGREQLERAERLADERVGAHLVRRLLGAAVGAGEQHDAETVVRVVGAQLAAEVEAASPGHANIEDDDVRLERANGLLGLGGARRLLDLHVEDFERRPEERPERSVVVHEQNSHSQASVVGPGTRYRPARPTPLG
jgi:hypothetical protein